MRGAFYAGSEPLHALRPLRVGEETYARGVDGAPQTSQMTPAEVDHLGAIGAALTKASADILGAFSPKAPAPRKKKASSGAGRIVLVAALVVAVVLVAKRK